MPGRLVIVSTLVLAGFITAPSRAADLRPASRMAILRGLVAEFGALQAPLPRGSKGLHLSSSGEIDREKLVHELTQEGTAIPANVLVQITQIFFRDKEIAFEINGGPKKKTKWYEHIEVEWVPHHPINNPNDDAEAGRGATITLVFPERLQDMTVDEIKDYLSPILDFEAKSQILTLNVPIPPEFKDAVEAKQAVVGMSQDMVLAALGQPGSKVRETKEGVEQEDWIYGAPPMKVTFVTFEGEEVVNVQEYTGGVRGETSPSPQQPPR